MAEIREFQREDIPAVVDLWVRTYRNGASRGSEALKSYFEEIYFNNPWSDLNLPCYVYEEEGGQIAGFIAAFPRRMTFRGRPIQVAVLSGLMVDPKLRGQLVGPRLLRKVLSGPQELSYTDGANDASRTLWTAVGGDCCLLYGCHWLRILRPFGYFLERLSRRKSLRSLTRILRPPAALIDAAFVRIPRNPYRLPQVQAVGEEATPESLLNCIAELGGKQALRPDYDLESLTWLLRETGGAARRGPLEAVIVKDAGGSRLGWYVYFAKRGGVSHVLQIGGKRLEMPIVLGHLFHRARSRGAVAVRGQFEPPLVTEMIHARCGFTFDDMGAFMHTRVPEIRQAVLSGDTSLSRLDGEWWMHFADGPW